MVDVRSPSSPVPLRALRSTALLACVALTSLACERQPVFDKRTVPLVILGPWLTDVQPNQITVAWTTKLPWRGEVNYGQAGNLDKTAHDELATTDHRVVLTGLAPGQKYDYTVLAEVNEPGSFTSAPDPGGDPFTQPFTVLVYGDNRTNGGDHALVVRSAGAQGAVLALHTGDMVVNAKDQKAWERWFDVESDLLVGTPIYPTVGNHEITDKGVTYSRHFQPKGRPTFRAIDYGNVHVQVLDSFELAAGADPHAGAVSDAQKAWAEADARSVPKDHHLWMLVHQGPYTHPIKMRPGHGGLEGVRQLIAAVAKVHQVEAVFAGHEHFYERGQLDGLNYLVIGGGGAPLEDPDPAAPGVKVAVKSLGFVVLEVCGCHVTGRALGISGKPFDTFTLSDCEQSCRPPAPAAAVVPSDGPATATGSVTGSVTTPAAAAPAPKPAAPPLAAKPGAAP